MTNIFWSKSVAVSVLMSVLAAVASAAAEPNAPSQANRSGWEALNLIQTTLAGTTVYYEKALEPNLPIFEREFNKFLADKEKASPFLEKKSLVVADINRIVGASDTHASDQEQLLADFVRPFAGPKPTFYLARMSTLKNYLRAGGQLPECSYNRNDDTVLYEPKIHVGQGSYDLCLPVPPDMDFAKYLSGILGRLQGGSAGIAIHEVTEATLMDRARPTDPYWRWFSDGFANAIAEKLLEKYVGKEAVVEFAADYDVNECRALESQINLRYWMMANWYPCVLRMPVKRESEINRARYAFATVEARRLIDINGIDCVRRILDKIAARESRKGSDLLAVVKEVTGQDMEPRWDRYQVFQARDEAMRIYMAAANAAWKASDYEKTYVNTVRVIELYGAMASSRHLALFASSAEMLFRMGYQNDGDFAIQHGIDLYSNSTLPHGREMAMGAFAAYMFTTNRPRKAEKAADEVLTVDPNHVASLAIKARLSVEDGHLAEAKEFARRIQRLTKPDSGYYQNAAQVLAIDPNRPNTYNRTP
jgi:hypothetical protein